VSGGSNGGYVFPDAIFSGGTISALPAVGTLSAYGTGGTVPNIVGDGAINISGSQLDGLVHGWSSVNLSVPAVGGEIVGNGVTLTGATVQGGTGGIVSSGSLTLANSTINGTAKYGSSYTTSGSTVSGGASLASPAPTLPLMRLMPTFNESSSDMNTLLGVGAPTATASCPGAGTGTYYDYSPLIALNCTYNPATINGPVVLVAHSLLGGVLNINVPQTTTGGQLYGALDTLNIVGSNSTFQVFAYSDGTLTTNGGVTGQLVGNTVATVGATTLTFAPPAIPAPDFAFSTSQTAPSGLGYAASIAFEYQCPGTTAC
jgi:hypothetical protein